MLNRKHHSFTRQKLPYKKIISVCMIFTVLLFAYFFTSIYIQKRINLFLIDQQSFLKKQNLKLEYKSSSFHVWGMWPQATISFPTLQSKIYPKSQMLWQAKQATISYSILHPLSLTIELDGEQLICFNKNSKNCYQIHGSVWNMLIPLINNTKRNSISLQLKKIFYTSLSQPTWNINSFELNDVSATLNWNNDSTSDTSSISFTIDTAHALVGFTSFPGQKLNNIKLQGALINLLYHKNGQYKLLLQNFNFNWSNLSIFSNGKFYLYYPWFLPTGEIFIRLNGIDQTIYQQLASLDCCNELKIYLAQTRLPSQLNLTLFVREGIVYLGAIPLQKIWYNHFINLINSYTK